MQEERATALLGVGRCLLQGGRIRLDQEDKLKPAGRPTDYRSQPVDKQAHAVSPNAGGRSSATNLPSRNERHSSGNGNAAAATASQQAHVYTRQRKPRVVLWSFIIALSLVLSVTGSALFYVWNGLRPPNASATPIRVTIEKGMRAQKVAELLEENGLIRNAQLFGGWLKLKSEGSRFQAGIYELTPGMTREEIVEKLNKGDIVAEATMRFTIPEGWTVQQMADRLAQNGKVDKAAFLQAASDPASWTGSVWAAQIPLEAELRYPLEGYLFPDTYEMKTESSAKDIINRMLAELDKKLQQLPDDWQMTLEERDLTLHELLTIASLIEREVVVDEERPIVSGVIANRLNKKMPLQIDATIQYLLDQPKELLYDDLKVESPYNTYLNNGLPPGPIASPSLKSIEAALYPEETEYFYYVTKKDGTNEHLFAVTLKQHQKNIEISNQNAKQ